MGDNPKEEVRKGAEREGMGEPREIWNAIRWEGEESLGKDERERRSLRWRGESRKEKRTSLQSRMVRRGREGKIEYKRSRAARVDYIESSPRMGEGGSRDRKKKRSILHRRSRDPQRVRLSPGGKGVLRGGEFRERVGILHIIGPFDTEGINERDEKRVGV